MLERISILDYRVKARFMWTTTLSSLYVRAHKRAIQSLLKATGAFNERAFHVLKKGPP